MAYQVTNEKRIATGLYFLNRGVHPRRFHGSRVPIHSVARVVEAQARGRDDDWT
jgi:hypothetical protein